jgi:thioredoxin-dependent peroxiredoxin
MQTQPLNVAAEAPHFELPDADMQTFSLTAQHGKNVVLYFYPRDDTSGCTLEANEFTDLIDDFESLDTVVVGVSRDDCLSHASFRDKYGLAVQLLSDPDARVCKKYAVM